MKLITISGLDGSGKTTQLDLIEKSLKKNFRVERLHMVSFSIANKFLRKNKNMTKSQPKANLKTGYWSVFLRKVAITIDVFRFRLYYLIKTAEAKTDYLLTDRYFYDQMINIKYLDKKNNWKKKCFCQKFVENLIIKPYLKIYLKITPQEILKRERNIEQGKEYLIKKYDLYQYFSKKWKMLEIDGKQKKQLIEEKIKQLL